MTHKHCGFQVINNKNLSMLFPHDHLTDDELLRDTYAQKNPTDRELELCHRIERLQDYIFELEDDGDDTREPG